MDYMKHNDCRCQTSSPSGICYDNYDILQDMPLAMAYVPWQQWQNVYDGAKGLENGTIFEELIFPFLCSSPICHNMRCNCQSSEQQSRNCTTSPIRRDMQCKNSCRRRCDV